MPETLGFSTRSIIGQFYAILEKGLAESWVDKISFPVLDSQQKVEHYRWLGMSPPVREWIDGRHPQGLRADNYDLENLKFEGTLDIEVDDLNRDKTGQIMLRVQELADRCNEHWEVLGSACLALGESALCYDGQPFFSVAHEEGKSGQQSNLLTWLQVPGLAVANPAGPTPLEMAKAILGCLAYQFGYKDDQGQLMNGQARKFLVMIGPSLFVPALAATTAARIAENGVAVDNPL